ncbi:MAG: AEC family transporter [Clostridia bacterium]|nr:AEC family transporter [Clostridia bacterium]
MTYDFTSLLVVIIVMFLMLAAGFFCRRIGWIDDVASKRLSTLIIKVGQPMMIIDALVNVQYTNENLSRGLLILAVGFFLHLLMSLLAFPLCIPYKDLNERKITEFSLIFTNCGFIGLPILGAIFGDIGKFYGAFYLISFNIFMYIWGLMILGRKRDDIRMTPKKALVNFGSIPCAIGVVLYLLRNPALGNPLIDTVVDDAFLMLFAKLASLCLPISVLITGALLATRTPKQLFCSGKIYVFSLCKLILIPAIVFVVCKLLGFSDDIVMFSTAVTALPTASIITMFSETYDISPGYASQTVGVSSLLCLGTLPLMVTLAQKVLQIW